MRKKKLFTVGPAKCLSHVGDGFVREKHLGLIQGGHLVRWDDSFYGLYLPHYENREGFDKHMHKQKDIAARNPHYK